MYVPFPEALEHKKKVLEVMGAKIAGEQKAKTEALLDELFSLAKIGVILLSMKQESGKTKLRELLRGPVKELRSRFGKDAEKAKLPLPAYNKVQELLTFKQ